MVEYVSQIPRLRVVAATMMEKPRKARKCTQDILRIRFEVDSKLRKGLPRSNTLAALLHKCAKKAVRKEYFKLQDVNINFEPGEEDASRPSPTSKGGTAKESK
jgi:hypothetical protein